MPMHDDHHRGSSDDAHVHNLRIALGSILSPKRPQMTRSSTTSGTASPAHSAIPISPSHSSSGSHPASTPIPHGHPHLHHHPHHPHLPQAHAHHNQPAMPIAESAMNDVHPLIPDAVAGHASAGSVPGNMTPGARAHFVETLQSKKRWDALIHGSWM